MNFQADEMGKEDEGKIVRYKGTARQLTAFSGSIKLKFAPIRRWI
jgi:hypothetical protein